MTITVSTDGSALGNPNGPMGWAWADHDTNSAPNNEHRHDGDCDAGGATNGTNQIGELCAVLEALRAHPGSEDLVIETDSQYAINCSTKWVHGWKKNGWKNAQKKPVKNAALIKAIDAELSKRPGSVHFKWVKGHAGNFGNEKVDDLAHTYSGDARSGVKDGYLPLEGWQSLLASDYAKGVDIPADAQLLLDGKISSGQYHLGRGIASSPDDNESSGNDGKDSNRYETAGATTSRQKPSSEELPAEPDEVARTGFEAANDAVTRDFDAAQNINLDSNPALGDSNAGYDERPNADAFADDPKKNDNDMQLSSGGQAPDNDRQPSDAGKKTPPATNEPSASQQITSGHTSGSYETGQSSRATGLTLSGTLRFSPPPSSSKTYDGRPRLIKGTVAVEGYVEGDGTITLSNAPFAVNMRQH
ncbi:MAG: ribonuclease HI [Bifidobacterium sp.]|jgi:ribonuclease HI|nr:ribonuclease HI [Bifidobacterium sp.]